MEVITQIAIQVPALFIMGFIFLRVLQLVLDITGKKLDRIADATEKLADVVKTQGRARR